MKVVYFPNDLKEVVEDIDEEFLVVFVDSEYGNQPDA